MPSKIEAMDIEISPAYDVVGGRWSRGESHEHFVKETYHQEDMNMGWKVTIKKGHITL